MDAPDTSWKRNFLLVGGLLGAVAGIIAAHVIIRNAEDEGRQPKLGASDGLRLGMSLMTMMRQIGRLGNGQ